jgi:hypothetical protein
LGAGYIQYWIQGVGAQNKFHLPHKTHDLLHNTTQHNLYDTSVSQVPRYQHDLERAKSSTTPTSIDIHAFNIIVLAPLISLILHSNFPTMELL